MGVVGDEVDVCAVCDHALVNGIEGPCEDDEGFEIPVVAGIWLYEVEKEIKSMIVVGHVRRSSSTVPAPQRLFEIIW